MATFKVNIKLNQGTDYTKVVTWKAGALKAPVDLTGCSALAHFREKITSPAPALILSTSNGGIVLGGTSGTISFVFKESDTVGVAWRGLVFDMELVMSDGKKRRLIAGSLALSPEVTRDD